MSFELVPTAKPAKYPSKGHIDCKYYGKGCIFDGHPSPAYFRAWRKWRDICYDCELRKYPERFRGCCFCGKALLYDCMCIGCYSGVRDFLFKLFHNENDPVWKYLAVQDGVREFISRQSTTVGKFAIRVYKFEILPEKWLGFRRADGSRVMPDPCKLKHMINVDDLTEKSAYFVMMRELNKLGINVLAEINICAGAKADVNESMSVDTSGKCRQWLI
jgi:hypothetical protein